MLNTTSDFHDVTIRSRFETVLVPLVPERGRETGAHGADRRGAFQTRRCTGERPRVRPFVLAGLCWIWFVGCDQEGRDTYPAVLETAVPNHNRAPAGTIRDGVLELELDARLARWPGEESALTPDTPDPSLVDVLAFAERGGPVTIPGPLIRVTEGTEVRVRVRNSIPDGTSIGLPPPTLRSASTSSIADTMLVVHGLRAGTTEDDTLLVRAGEVREVRYRAERPGTYLYWATPSNRSIDAWTGRDAQLAGAILVDPAGAEPDPDERIFVITMLDQYADSARPPPHEEYLRRSINGSSWPDTERFEYAVGDTVRWRWINASFEVHPMHLHGFHYSVVATGDGRTETVHPEGERRLAVTELMAPGGTFRMEWIPTRPGNWIFHCHILDHIVPAVERDEAERAADAHDVERHALEAMAGLVVGITVTDERLDTDAPPDHEIRLLAQESDEVAGIRARGFVLPQAAEPPADSVAVPGPPLLLTRDETTAITVVNHLSEMTTVHWHGLELESVYDGVAGWSRTGQRIAPLVMPGDSFTVRIRPPRSGTYIYHTHMDETDQLAQGLHGPLLVLDPGDVFDPQSDPLIVIGGQPEGGYPVTINGSVEPPPMTFEVGQPYRLRFVQITRGVTVDIALTRGAELLRWRAVAEDGADLPSAMQRMGDAQLRANTGETFDFLWTPETAGDATLSVRYDRFFERQEVVLTQRFRVH